MSTTVSASNGARKPKRPVLVKMKVLYEQRFDDYGPALSYAEYLIGRGYVVSCCSYAADESSLESMAKTAYHLVTRYEKSE